MVPPPESTGDEFPDFENMSFEEQMAWLESLAKRQGARQEELTTAANVEIAEIPADTVIDEPGYVPFADSRAAREAQRAKLDAEARAAEEVPSAAAEPEPEAQFSPIGEAVESPMEEAPWEVSLTEEAEPEEMIDPMHWLDDLAAHPGQAEAGLDFSLDEVEQLDSVEDFNAVMLDNIPEPAEIEFDFGLDLELELEPQEEPFDFMLPDLSIEAESEPVPATDDNPLGEIDPMLWLESLAARQGARAEELTTSANLEIPEVPEDAVIDEPGYVPYDVITEGRKPAAKPEPRPAPEEAAPSWEELPVEQVDRVSDPAAWLESLSSSQDMELEEFALDAELDLPEETFIEEPDYADYLPASLPPEFEAADEPLSWLEELAAVPEDEGAGDFLAFEAEEAPAQSPEQVWSPEEILAGMSDEEIAAAQAQGRLTGEQELAWLQRQALKLAEARKAEEEMLSEEELAPAEPAEMPPWLQEMRETEFIASDEPQVPVLVEDELALPESDVPDWLAESAPESVFGVEELSLDADVESLWADVPAEIEPLPIEEGVSESELDAFLKGDFALEEPDQLAEALDAEYERRLVGDESEPEWYTDAVAQSAPEDQLETEAPPVEEPAVDLVLEEAVPVEMPDWLRETTEEVEPASEIAMPDWLMEEPEPEAVEPEAPAAVPAWLAEEVPEEAAAAAAGWLAAPEPEPEVAVPQAARIPPAEPPVVVREPKGVVALPESGLFAQYRERLEQDPGDYTTRLVLARALRANNELTSSMDQYDVLIDAVQLLQDVSDDLVGLLGEHPDDPRLRRLMGDTYMRRGMLQQALEAYRSALDRL